VTVRAARPDDLSEICALIRELADYEHLADEVVLDEAEVGRWIFEERVASVLVAEEPGVQGGGPRGRDALVGMALWFPTFSTFLGRPGIWLEDLFVRPAFRGRGHGLALLQALRAMTDGRVEWAVLDWNEPSIGFYESLGARPLAGWTTYRWAQAGDGVQGGAQ
jgi:GNAT superfamily N-acetyltransferase